MKQILDIDAPTVTLCYEAGYDGFWLARFLEQRGIECLVMEPASLQVNRRARRVKTDRPGSLLPAVRQSTTGRKLYRPCPQPL